ISSVSKRNRAIRLCTFLSQWSLVFYPGPQTLNSPSADLEAPFALLYRTGSIPIRVWRDRAITFPSKDRDDLPQGFVDASQEKQGKAGEQSGADTVPPESKCYGSPRYDDEWNCVPNPVGRQTINHALLGLLYQGGNPPLHLGRQPVYPALNVGG